MLAATPLGLRCGSGLCATVHRGTLFVNDGTTVHAVRDGRLVQSYAVQGERAMPVGWACGLLDPRVAAFYRAPFLVLRATRDRASRARERAVHMNPVGIPLRMAMTRKRLAVAFERRVVVFDLGDMSVEYEAPSPSPAVAIAGDGGVVESAAVLAHPCAESRGNVRIVVNGRRRRTVHAHDHDIVALAATMELVHTMSKRSTLVRTFRSDTGQCVSQVRVSYLMSPVVCGMEACGKWVAVSTEDDAYVVNAAARTVSSRTTERGPKLAWTDADGELTVLTESGTLHTPWGQRLEVSAVAR